jgi:hypothetical protein
MTTTINGRTFTLTEVTEEHANLRADMIRRGFDGGIWNGFSARTGRQRKDIYSMIWRSAKTGQFVAVASF